MSKIDVLKKVGTQKRLGANFVTVSFLGKGGFPVSKIDKTET